MGLGTVIGLTGSFGSGCSYIAAKYLVPRGYRYVSLSQTLRQMFPGANRHELQEHGNELRRAKGADFLAKAVVDQISADRNQEKWVIDSIRNPEEIRAIQARVPRFFLFAVFADQDVRWSRIKSRYGGNQDQFEEDDRKDAGDQEEQYGQRVRDCYIKADVIISNNKDIRTDGSDPERDLRGKVDQFMDYAEEKRTFVPDSAEALMAMAYANGFRSRCLKRQVGAIVADPLGNVISSGFNDVPPTEDTCQTKHNTCYRDILKEEYARDLAPMVADEVVRRNLTTMASRFKNLDHCRALHAEENAILNAPSHIRIYSESPQAQVGEGERAITLYVTTYPCNLCANKIVRSSIRRVVYLEPYPMREAKEILTNGCVRQVPFEGVTFNGYFRLGGGCR